MSSYLSTIRADVSCAVCHAKARGIHPADAVDVFDPRPRRRTHFRGQTVLVENSVEI